MNLQVKQKYLTAWTVILVKKKDAETINPVAPDKLL